MGKLIEKVKGLDLSQAVEYIDKISRLKQEILAKSSELYEVRQNYITYLEQALKKKTDK